VNFIARDRSEQSLTGSKQLMFQVTGEGVNLRKKPKETNKVDCQYRKGKGAQYRGVV
jgi:hypothetical protein